ncbi:hypothetical protein [Aeoliella mucimassa]|uniref:Uncharacterized protein n=1 Tax=Aeoliella mucimassa TaxID=2527972 RepID=A0A518ANX5_9BACT|nr:hypothetical protein [Aeoliella mucimassa]QDU56425.1 hypothetical protein Pan181_26340 [Aeoliella mucimassa]
MTKFITAFLTVALTLTTFVGCSSKPEKTDEEKQAEAVQQREDAMSERSAADGR